jgi:hypothetical protein
LSPGRRQHVWLLDVEAARGGAPHTRAVGHAAALSERQPLLSLLLALAGSQPSQVCVAAFDPTQRRGRCWPHAALKQDCSLCRPDIARYHTPSAPHAQQRADKAPLSAPVCTYSRRCSQGCSHGARRRRQQRATTTGCPHPARCSGWSNRRLLACGCLRPHTTRWCRGAATLVVVVVGVSERLCLECDRCN